MAGVGSRFLALLIDTLIQTGLLILAGIVLALLGFTGLLVRAPLAMAWMLAGLIALAFLLLYGYFILFEIFWSGQTPGKRRIGLRVVKDTGRRLSPLETIARNLVRIVDQLPGFYALGIVVALCNRQNKRLGDFVAGSLVIREASLSQIKQTWNRPESPGAPHAPLGAGRLSEDDLILIESFLQRRHELLPDIRRRIAGDIFHRVETKLTVTSGEQPDLERLLEAAVHERRAGNGA